MPKNKSKLGVLICQLVVRMEQGDNRYTDLLALHLTRQEYEKVIKYLNDHVNYPEPEVEWD